MNFAVTLNMDVQTVQISKCLFTLITLITLQFKMNSFNMEFERSCIIKAFKALSASNPPEALLTMLGLIVFNVSPLSSKLFFTKGAFI